MAELQWIRGVLADRRLSIIAKATGISEPTIRKIRDDANANPTVQTLEKLAAYFQERAA